jgi:heme/copper-type cytochrome/quinol oxidase subunit 2
MRKAIFLVVLSVSFIVSLIMWLAAPSAEYSAQELVLILGAILVVGFALFLAFRRLRDVKEKLPTEDEMSKNIMRRGTATAYHLSIFLWLVIMYFSDKTRLECHTLIGAGIMGMAILFALSWLYHRYIRRSHD